MVLCGNWGEWGLGPGPDLAGIGLFLFGEEAATGYFPTKCWLCGHFTIHSWSDWHPPSPAFLPGWASLILPMMLFLPPQGRQNRCQDVQSRDLLGPVSEREISTQPQQFNLILNWGSCTTTNHRKFSKSHENAAHNCCMLCDDQIYKPVNLFIIGRNLKHPKIGCSLSKYFCMSLQTDENNPSFPRHLLYKEKITDNH